MRLSLRPHLCHAVFIYMATNFDVETMVAPINNWSYNMFCEGPPMMATTFQNPPSLHAKSFWTILSWPAKTITKLTTASRNRVVSEQRQPNPHSGNFVHVMLPLWKMTVYKYNIQPLAQPRLNLHHIWFQERAGRWTGMFETPWRKEVPNVPRIIYHFLKGGKHCSSLNFPNLGSSREKKINIRPQFACSVLYFQTNLWYLAACVCVKVRFCFCMLPHEGVAEHVRKRRNPQRRWTVLLWDRFRGNYGESFLLKGKLRAGYTAKGAPRQAMRGCFYCRSRLRGAYAQYLSYGRGYARLRKATQRYVFLQQFPPPQNAA